MKNLKLLCVASLLVLSNSVFAANSSKGKTPLTTEISRMLEDSKLIIDEEFTVTVFFTVTEDRRIELRTIQSPNEEVNEFLKKRLENRKLYGDSWFTEKIYELPVKVQARK
jgi:hypothetical protein